MEIFERYSSFHYQVCYYMLTTRVKINSIYSPEIRRSILLIKDESLAYDICLSNEFVLILSDVVYHFRSCESVGLCRFGRFRSV